MNTLYNGKQNDKLDIDQAAMHLANFLESCVSEMKLVAQALGKTALREIVRDDLVTVDKELAEFLHIRNANSPRKLGEMHGNVFQTKDNVELRLQ